MIETGKKIAMVLRILNNVDKLLEDAVKTENTIKAIGQLEIARSEMYIMKDILDAEESVSDNVDSNENVETEVIQPTETEVVDSAV